MRKEKCVWAALTAALFLAGALMSTAHSQYPDLDQSRETADSLLFGCNMVANPHVLYYPDGYNDDVFGTLQYLGARLVRLCASPREIERVRGTRDWSEFDRSVEQALRFGLEPMVLICNTPLWALPPEIETLPPGMDPTYQYPYRTDLFPEFADFCRELAERTRGKVRLFQLWNEANGCSWHFHDGYNHADEYVPFLAITYPAIKEGNPDAKLLLTSLDDAGGYAHIFLNLTYEIRDEDYPGQRLFDGVTLHPYDYDIANKEHKIRRMYQIMADNGDGELPIFITEYGWRTGPERDSVKRDRLRETLEMFQKPNLDFLKGSIHLSLTDFDGEPGFGLMDENLRPRESFQVFQGTPRFGASPPHTIEWKPLPGGRIEVSWKTVLPATGTLILTEKGEVRHFEVPAGTEHQVILDGLEPGSRSEFTLESVVVETGKSRKTPPYPIYVPGEAVTNGDFRMGFFGGIARGWWIEGPGLCTDGHVFPGIELPEGEHCQVILAVPERGIGLESTARTYVRARSGEPIRVALRAANASHDSEASTLIRVGLHSHGGDRKEEAQWSAWEPLGREWHDLSVSAGTDEDLVTIFVETRGQKLGESGRPAVAFGWVEVMQ